MKNKNNLQIKLILSKKKIILRKCELKIYELNMENSQVKNFEKIIDKGKKI